MIVESHIDIQMSLSVCAILFYCLVISVFGLYFFLLFTHFFYFLLERAFYPRRVPTWRRDKQNIIIIQRAFWEIVHFGHSQIFFAKVKFIFVHKYAN